MKKQKYYVVLNGRINGIFLNWNDCKEMIQGFSNASYKSFYKPYEAMDYLQKNIEKDVSTDNKKNIDKNCDENQHIDTIYGNNDIIEAYVDGSFDSTFNTYGSGVVILKNDVVIEQFSIKGDNDEFTSMRNVAGEINASIIAMKYCYDNNYDNLTIYYDYNGIEKWFTGEWKANKKGTQEYKKISNFYGEKIKIKFVKVKAHSGNKYNELADELAKKSIKINL
ncbi:ribonuclease H1 domain-containing protein [Peptostreptococcus sp. D1]|uniref:ribonuclease H1 domain-containing protein n=1 Tax=Peptostreptococcus sp. D1 TaxID=72304 RepID=UPI0008E9709F|nr:ribonuclease H family protein [Peptostreptococcus sp. D1]SFE62816.1 ribonuclease HI [Peptostreptococcus sp. D1]